ncbi:MAG: YeeE/YedE family protein [Coriobacteriales bacterium]|jgi:uncharacterized membrane protein YedE/YeeE|nr:YeeE/YedE family protein [Coriobacteriales bacterium]
MQVVLSALALGLVFGFLLQKAGLTHYDKVVNQFRFRDFTLMKFMLSAILVAMVGIYALKDLGLLEIASLPETYSVGNIVGGLIFGAGMAIAGMCPGTVLTGAGQGNLDYLVAGGLGFVTGGMLFGATYETLFLPLLDLAPPEALTLETALRVNHWLFIAIFALMVAVFFWLTEIKGKTGRTDAEKTDA